MEQLFVLSVSSRQARVFPSSKTDDHRQYPIQGTFKSEMGHAPRLHRDNEHNQEVLGKLACKVALRALTQHTFFTPLLNWEASFSMEDYHCTVLALWVFVTLETESWSNRVKVWESLLNILFVINKVANWGLWEEHELRGQMNLVQSTTNLAFPLLYFQLGKLFYHSICN